MRNATGNFLYHADLTKHWSSVRAVTKTTSHYFSSKNWYVFLICERRNCAKHEKVMKIPPLLARGGILYIQLGL